MIRSHTIHSLSQPLRNPAVWLLMSIAASILTACAPVVSEDTPRPLVALINAPGEERPTQITAEVVQSNVEEVRGCCSFSFMRSAPIRFQETHRNLFGSRAIPHSAALARNLTADIAVLVGTPVFERTVTERRGEARVEGEVRVRAVVVDAQTEETLATIPSRVFSGQRTQDSDEPLPAEGEDPLLRVLIGEAAADVAPHLAAVLEDVAAQWRAR